MTRVRPSGSDTGADAQTAGEWFVVDYATDRVMRGPYESAATAVAVREEMERQERYDEKNLRIVSESWFADPAPVAPGGDA